MTEEEAILQGALLAAAGIPFEIKVKIEDGIPVEVIEVVAQKEK